MSQIDEPKQTRLNIRASRRQKQLLEKAARLRSVSVSSFVLQHALDEARSVIAEQTRFPLGEREWRAFCEALDEPPRKIPELRRLLTEKGVFDA